MPTFLVSYARTLSVRHAVTETLEVEVEADDADAARDTLQAMIDGGDVDGDWCESRDEVVGADDVGPPAFVSAVPSGGGSPPDGRRHAMLAAALAAGMTDVDLLERSASYLGWLKLAADEPDRLRRVDVDRVLSAVPAALRDDFKAWLLPQVSMYAVREAISAWEPDD